MKCKGLSMERDEKMVKMIRKNNVFNKILTI